MSRSPSTLSWLTEFATSLEHWLLDSFEFVLEVSKVVRLPELCKFLDGLDVRNPA